MSYLIYRETQKATDYQDLANRLASNQTILRILLLEALVENDAYCDDLMATLSDFVANKRVNLPLIGVEFSQEESESMNSGYLHCGLWHLVERAAQEAIGEYLVDYCGEFADCEDELEQVAA